MLNFVKTISTVYLKTFAHLFQSLHCSKNIALTLTNEVSSPVFLPYQVYEYALKRGPHQVAY